MCAVASLTYTRKVHSLGSDLFLFFQIGAILRRSIPRRAAGIDGLSNLNQAELKLEGAFVTTFNPFHPDKLGDLSPSRRFILHKLSICLNKFVTAFTFC